MASYEGRRSIYEIIISTNKKKQIPSPSDCRREPAYRVEGNQGQSNPSKVNILCGDYKQAHTVKANLTRRGINTPPDRPVCGNTKTREHMLCQYEWAK